MISQHKFTRSCAEQVRSGQPRCRPAVRMVGVRNRMQSESTASDAPTPCLLLVPCLLRCLLPAVLHPAVRVVGVRDWRFNQHIEDIEWLLKLQSADGSASTGVCRQSGCCVGLGVVLGGRVPEGEAGVSSSSSRWWQWYAAEAAVGRWQRKHRCAGKRQQRIDSGRSSGSSTSAAAASGLYTRSRGCSVLDSTLITIYVHAVGLLLYAAAGNKSQTHRTSLKSGSEAAQHTVPTLPPTPRPVLYMLKVLISQLGVWRWGRR